MAHVDDLIICQTGNGSNLNIKRMLFSSRRKIYENASSQHDVITEKSFTSSMRHSAMEDFITQCSSTEHSMFVQ